MNPERRCLPGTDGLPFFTQPTSLQRTNGLGTGEKEQEQEIAVNFRFACGCGMKTTTQVGFSSHSSVNERMEKRSGSSRLTVLEEPPAKRGRCDRQSTSKTNREFAITTDVVGMSKRCTALTSHRSLCGNGESDQPRPTDGVRTVVSAGLTNQQRRCKSSSSSQARRLLRSRSKRTHGARGRKVVCLRRFVHSNVIDRRTHSSDCSGDGLFDGGILPRNGNE